MEFMPKGRESESSAASMYSTKSQAPASSRPSSLERTTSVNPADYVWGVPSLCQQQRLYHQFTQLALFSGASCCPVPPPMPMWGNGCYAPNFPPCGLFSNAAVLPEASGRPLQADENVYASINMGTLDKGGYEAGPPHDDDLWRLFQDEDVPLSQSLDGINVAACLSSSIASAVASQELASTSAGFAILEHALEPADADGLQISMGEFDSEFEQLDCALKSKQAGPLSGATRKAPEGEAPAGCQMPRVKKARSSDNTRNRQKPAPGAAASSVVAGNVFSTVAATFSSIMNAQLSASYQFVSPRTTSEDEDTLDDSCGAAAADAQQCVVPQGGHYGAAPQGSHHCIVPQVPDVFSLMNPMMAVHNMDFGSSHTPGVFAVPAEERDTLDDLKNMLCTSYDSCTSEWEASLMLRFEDPCGLYA